MTWIECPFLSVVLLRRLKTGFKLLRVEDMCYERSKDGNPLVDGRLTVRSPRPVVHAALKELLARVALWYMWRAPL